MRVKASGDPRLEEFDAWTVSLGNGTSMDANGCVTVPDQMFYEIQPNSKNDQKSEEQSMSEFCKTVFPDLCANISSHGWLEGRSLLAPTNKEVDTINDLMEGWVPGSTNRLTSADTLKDYRDVMRFSTEYLNSLNPNGFARHIISLKPGMPLMILRNISPKEGLCNGTKVIFQRTLNNRLLLI